MRIRLLVFLFTIILLASALAVFRQRPRQENTPPAPAAYPDLGPAPELVNDTWLNSDQPLRLADLHGKVVLLDMWTFG